MRFGIVYLFCPICGRQIVKNKRTPPHLVHHTKEWGNVCSRECYEKGELKYARMVLGKDDFEPPGPAPFEPGWFQEDE